MDEIEVNGAFVISDNKEVCDSHVKTDPKERQDFYKQAENDIKCIFYQATLATHQAVSCLLKFQVFITLSINFAFKDINAMLNDGSVVLHRLYTVY